MNNGWKFEIGALVIPVAEPRHPPMQIVGRMCDECPGSGVQRRYLTRGRGPGGGFTNEMIQFHEIELAPCEAPGTREEDWEKIKARFSLRDKADVELLNGAAGLLALIGSGDEAAERWLKRYHEHTNRGES